MNAHQVRRFLAIASALVALLLPRDAYSQQMSFSYYSDIVVSSDGQTLNTIIDGYDNSSGCTHNDYENIGYVYGPTGNYQQSFPGLSTYMNVPTAEGNYAFSSNVTVNCSCFGSGLGAGGGNGSAASQAYVHHYLRTAIGNPSTYTLQPDSLGKRCSHSTLTWPSSPSPEPTQMSDDGLYYSFAGNPVACLSVCTSGWAIPVKGPAGPTLAAASCG